MKKSIISVIICMVVFTILNVSSVKAAEESVVLTPGDNNVLVTLHMDSTLEAFSMKASFKVEATKGSVQNVKFNFDQSMTSTVNEYRYQADSNTLTVYISGKKDLILDDTMTLGNISFDATSNTDVNITFIEDSLQYVSSAYSKTDLALEESSVNWTNIPVSNPDKEETGTNDEQDNQNDSEESQIFASENENTLNKQNEVKEQEEANTATNADTGVQINILFYACLTVISLIIVLLIMKRSINKANH